MIPSATLVSDLQISRGALDAEGMPSGVQDFAIITNNIEYVVLWGPISHHADDMVRCADATKRHIAKLP
jgi:hypothetical protein